MMGGATTNERKMAVTVAPAARKVMYVKRLKPKKLSFRRW
jgi:hypothetical protein